MMSLWSVVFAMCRPVAIVTGGTRGVGKGIAHALAYAGNDLVLTYNSDHRAARATAHELEAMYARTVKLVASDLSTPEGVEDVFACYDRDFAATHSLGACVHSAGQVMGITSEAPVRARMPKYGDGSLLTKHGGVVLDEMHYYPVSYTHLTLPTILLV